MQRLKVFLKRGENPNAASSKPQPTLNADQPSPSFTNPGQAPSFPDGVEVWRDCPNATVDICFVHGLTGNRNTTWTARGQVAPWPKTLLPPKLPGARLLTYGYDAYIVRKSVASTNQLIDHATNLLNDLTNDRASCNASSRRLILVAHSLGGLVCKEAILLSRNNPEPHLRGIFDCIIGIIFMGTPHRGAWMAGWANIPISALGIVKSTNKSLLRILETDSQQLGLIQARFQSMIRDLREHGRRLEITCFFEELPLPIAGQVVSKESATLDGYTPVSVHADHRDMVRFGSTGDTGFKRLLGELTRWEGLVTPALKSQHVVEAIPLTDQTTLPCCYIPLPRNKRFVGRVSTLDALKQMLFVQKCQKVALAGLGGVGKTQVALHLAYWAKEHQPEYSIFWVPALSSATFEQAYMEMARKLPIQTSSEDEDRKESVRRFLSSDMAGPWLLIVDNADDLDDLIGSPKAADTIIQHLPESEKGLTLFTTRLREVAVAVAGSDMIELHEMDEQEAMSFLNKSLFRKDVLHDESIAEELLQELTYLPLAITQAAAYLNTKQVPIADYLELLRGTEKDLTGLMSKEFYDQTRYRGSQNAIATTWLVSFDQIYKTDSVAAELLCFMSCIEPKAIPQSILPPRQSDQQMVDAIGTLCSYAFVTRRGNSKIFDMHRLVHLATRIWVRQHNRLVQVSKDTTQHLAKFFPSDDYVNRFLWREYLPHALRVLQEQEGDETEERCDLSTQVGQCLLVDGRIRETVKWLEVAYKWKKGHFPEDHQGRLASQHALATAYQNDGQVKKAIELLEHVIAVQEMTLTDDHPNQLASQYALATAYQIDGQVKKAIELLEHVVAVREMTLTDDHPNRLASQYALAIAYQDDGQVKKAIELLEHIVEVEEMTLADDHPDRLASQHNLTTLTNDYSSNNHLG